jgi:DNA-binding NarL/FixJ family response regulator
MSGKWRILIVEDHFLLRAGLRALLSQDPDIEIVGEADNGCDAVYAIESLMPHLVLMDLSMPGMNGIEAIIEIKRHHPKTRVMMLTIHKTDEYIRETLHAGADGYILNDATYDELRIAIHSVLSGRIYLSPAISAKVIDGYLGKAKSGSALNALAALTRRERAVLKLVAEGNPNKYIAEHLCLSVKTVEKHRYNLMKKLDLHNASSLTYFAIENGLLAH